MDAWEEELPVEEAVSDYREFFAGYTAVTAEIEELIRSYVHDRAVNGIFRESTGAFWGSALDGRRKVWLRCGPAPVVRFALLDQQPMSMGE